MSKFKLLFTDLDGTLLADHENISDVNKDAIDRAIKEGLDVIPCTGRSLKQLPDWLFDHKGINYAICSNGATIYNFKEKRIEKANNISQEVAIELVTKIKDLHQFPSLYIDDTMHTQKGYLDSIRDKTTPEWVEHIEKQTIAHDSLADLIAQEPSGVQKIQFDFNDFDHRIQVVGKLNGLFPDLNITASGANNIEVNHQDAQKGKAVRYLMDKYNVNKDEVIVIGDNINDISMLEAVTHSVAMGNGEKRVKDAAKYVTATSDQDGVAKAIDKLVFNK